MVLRRFLILTLLFSSNVLCADLTNKASKIAEILADIKKEQGYPGISLAISFKEDIYTDQIGYADAAKERPVKDETIFRMYSLTKGLTEILKKLNSEKEKNKSRIRSISQKNSTSKKITSRSRPRTSSLQCRP